MNMLSKLAGLAQKALDKSGTTNQPQSAGQKDWRAIRLASCQYAREIIPHASTNLLAK